MRVSYLHVILAPGNIRHRYDGGTGAEESAILAHASALLQFHARHAFCGKVWQLNPVLLSTATVEPL